MNDELKQILAKMLGSAHDFVLAEAPEVVRQYLAWAVLSGWVGVGFALLGVGCGIWLLRWSLTQFRNADGDFLDASLLWVLAGTAGALMTVIGLVCVVDNGMSALHASLYPKSYLLRALL